MAGTFEPLLRASGLLYLRDFGLTGKGGSVGFVTKQSRFPLLGPARALLKSAAPAVSVSIHRRSTPLTEYLSTSACQNRFRKHTVLVLDVDWLEVSSNNNIALLTASLLRDYIVFWALSGAPQNIEKDLSERLPQHGLFASLDILPPEIGSRHRELLRASLCAALGCMLLEFIASAQEEENVERNVKLVLEILKLGLETRPHGVFPSAESLKSLEFACKLLEAGRVKQSDRNLSEMRQMTAKDLKLRRNECGLSVRRMARVLGVEEDYLRRLERGEDPIPDEISIRIVEVLQSFPVVDNGAELYQYPDFGAFDLQIATLSRRDLKQRRQECGLSLRSMAVLLNVEEYLLRQVERGEAQLTPDMAACALDIFEHHCST